MNGHTLFLVFTTNCTNYTNRSTTNCSFNYKLVQFVVISYLLYFDTALSLPFVVPDVHVGDALVLVDEDVATVINRIADAIVQAQAGCKHCTRIKLNHHEQWGNICLFHLSNLFIKKEARGR